MSQEQETTLELPFPNNLLPLRNFGCLEQDNTGQVNFKSRFVANSAENSRPRLVCNRALPNQAQVKIYLEPVPAVFRTVRPNGGKVAIVILNKPQSSKALEMVTAQRNESPMWG